MPLTAGTRLGPYEVLAPLGAGGMAVVTDGTGRRALEKRAAQRSAPHSCAPARGTG